jgi:hypothetical protein
LTVFPDLKAKRTKFTIYKISNHASGRGGIFSDYGGSYFGRSGRAGML